MSFMLVYSATVGTVGLFISAVVGVVQVLQYRANRRDKAIERARSEPQVSVHIEATSTDCEAMVLRLAVTNTGHVEIPDCRAFLIFHVTLPSDDRYSPERLVKFPFFQRRSGADFVRDSVIHYSLDGSLGQQIGALRSQGARPSVVIQNGERPIGRFTGQDIERAVGQLADAMTVPDPAGPSAVVAKLTAPTAGGIQ